MKATSQYRNHCTSGFTLIEILLALAIVALLVALLFTVFSSTRNKSRMTSCASNLHQIHLALAQYSSDSSGLLPPYPSQLTAAGTSPPASSACLEQSSELVSSLLSYTRSNSIWRCPSDNSSTSPRTSSCSNTLVNNSTSYNYQGWDWSIDQKGISAVGLDYLRGDASKRSLIQDDSTCPDGGSQYGEYNHGRQWNRVFFDGHIKTFSLACSIPGRPAEK
ncbi:MAG: prepilin-type N-terminal cleavage/methylation domain-containing protein [Proteobacteria bacterium]|nr:MAG: prepilin-type N-terminal cleavage/methylation domain-containing protein [Pseudomonadota bacterium]